MEPEVADLLISQPNFPLLSEVVDKVAMVSVAPTADEWGAGGFGQAHLLAAAALKDEVGRTPLVGSAKRNFFYLVVRFTAISNPLGYIHLLRLPPPPPVECCFYYNFNLLLSRS